MTIRVESISIVILPVAVALNERLGGRTTAHRRLPFARNSAVGHDMPEMTYCPLVPRGAQATVTSAGDVFAVSARADDAAAAAETWRRAQLLTPPH